MAPRPSTTKQQARIAGVWYLLLALTAPVGLVYVPGELFVPGNASATSDNIRSAASLLRLGIASAAAPIVPLHAAAVARWTLPLKTGELPMVVWLLGWGATREPTLAPAT